MLFARHIVYNYLQNLIRAAGAKILGILGILGHIRKPPPLIRKPPLIVCQSELRGGGFVMWNYPDRSRVAKAIVAGWQ